MHQTICPTTRITLPLLGLLTALPLCQPAAESGPIADSPQLRPLATDRPDATESPVTVDAGRFQLESSFVTFTRDDDSAGVRTESLGLMEGNLKLGLDPATDLQLVFTPYLRETTRTATGKTVQEDFSDLTLRLKRNLWGNDDGATAFGLLPFVKIPTGTEVSNGRWEAGIATPFVWRAGDRWSLGGQLQLDRAFNDADNRMEWQFSHTLVLGLELAPRAGIYLEYLGVATEGPYHRFFSGGATYAVSPTVQLDVGGLIGLNEAAEDLTLFSGISWKF